MRRVDHAAVLHEFEKGVGGSWTGGTGQPAERSENELGFISGRLHLQAVAAMPPHQRALEALGFAVEEDEGDGKCVTE